MISRGCKIDYIKMFVELERKYLIFNEYIFCRKCFRGKYYVIVFYSIVVK